MWHRQAPTPTKTKHIVYLIASTILGLLLSISIHVWIETDLINWADKSDTSAHLQWYGNCSLPWLVQIILPMAGGVSGYLLGRWWWRVVYIEQRWRKRE